MFLLTAKLFGYVEKSSDMLTSAELKAAKKDPKKIVLDLDVMDDEGGGSEIILARSVPQAAQEFAKMVNLQRYPAQNVGKKER